MDIRGILLSGKAAGAWSYFPASSAEGVETWDFYHQPWLWRDSC